MPLKVLLIAVLGLTLFSGCQIGYLIRSSYDHLSMLSSRVPIEKALQSETLSSEHKRKIAISQEARDFAFNDLGFKRSNNYSHFVQLDRPYITYAVMAAHKWKFEPYHWDFPFIGKAPYKGYYNELSAKEEALLMKEKGFDVYVRGVSAYSTLGRLNDPLLSSMLAYKEHDLVNTVIHELVHTHLFIKSSIDFNERLAVFVAAKGTELFYLKKEGLDSETLKLIKNENEDDRLFSEFITSELIDLKLWYENNSFSPSLTAEAQEKIRQDRFQEIRNHFISQLVPKLKTKSYARFTDGEMNNARLGNYQTYMKDLQDFEKVFAKSGRHIATFLKKCAELNDTKDPELELKKWANE
ncbi:MAG: aminopeptidase [Bdellovibrionales bacterium RIFCSPHIGHO2_01_FULL_40_29]|nr:MAG: aminopeptidase [Bdellovibrionales bacterium RIFCSPHIGHO2_01_FULL_40_29]OFZ35565.1 MAG: aminopeptidase [Bdellovibrionales bacterium RIFCSPHIGHO2_02_FULL_40_15]